MDSAHESVRARHSSIRACENCNRRKKKCNGEKPKCHLCNQAGAICTYPRFSLRPGPKIGSKRARRDTQEPKEVQHLEAPYVVTDDRQQTLTAYERWQSSDIAPLCPTSSSDLSTPQQLAAYQATESHSKLYQKSVIPVQDPSLRQIQSVPPSHLSPVSDPLLPAQKDLNYLIEVFFDFVHPQLRLLHRPSFLPWVQSGAFISDPDSSLLLSAICALAARYLDQPEVDLFDRSLSKESISDSSQRHSGYRRRKRWERGKGFLDQANRLFQSKISTLEKLELDSGMMRRPSIRFVQAAALLSFAEVGLRVSSRAYSSISISVRLAYDCGLNKIDQYDNSGTEFVSDDADDPRNNIVKKEELRRAWWAIADLENFICTTRSRPRMIDWETCKTKLPCDDKDWFEGRECPSFFLPANLSDLQTFLDLPSHISVMAYRILASHLLAKLIKLAASDDGVTQTHGSLSAIEECAISWKSRIPKNVVPAASFQQTEGDEEVSSDVLPLCIQIETILLLLPKIRLFRAATPSTFFHYCQDIAGEPSYLDQSPEKSVAKTLESEAFSAMLCASDDICSIVRDWSTHSMARSCPFIAGALWMPACLQLLVKSFAGADSILAEKASLSLRVLSMAMEQFAEFWGIGQFLLDSFQVYEQKLTNLNWSDEGQRDVDQLVTRRVVSLPDYVNASFLKGLSQPCSLDNVTELENGAVLEEHLDPTTASDSVQLATLPWYVLPDGTVLFGEAMEDPNDMPWYVLPDGTVLFDHARGMEVE